MNSTPSIPNLRIVVAMSFLLMAGFAAVSAYVIGWSADLTTKGSIISTWQNFALLAVGFWLGSSSGGKTKMTPDDAPSGRPGDPVSTTDEPPPNP
jgi:hypothetical protein